MGANEMLSRIASWVDSIEGQTALTVEEITQAHRLIRLAKLSQGKDISTFYRAIEDMEALFWTVPEFPTELAQFLGA